MSGTPIMPYQKIANGTLQEFRFASTGRVIDLDEYVPYTDAQLTNIPDIKPTDTLNTAVKILDGKIRALDRDKAEDGDLSAVAKSGDYDDLTNKPYIPVKVSDLTNDTGYITGVSWDDVSDKPASFTPADHTHKTSDINSLSGYVKAASAAEITAADSLNVALGKIQKTLDAKQNSADVIAEADKATKDGSGNVITTTYATKDEVSAIPKFKIQVVNSLPATGDAATVYLVKTGDESGNLYTEYIYVNNKWEELGTQALDLSGYALKSELPVDVSELNNDAGYLTASDKINSATNADNATKATKDSSGQTITETYVKGLSVNGRTITITKGDDTTSTIQTQDTTYGAATSNKLGLVMTGANITNTNGILSLTQSNVTSALGYTPPTQDTTYGLATQTESGLMSNTDKVRLDNIEDNANNYVHPTSGATAGSYGPTANVTGTNNTTINVPQITIDANGHVTGVTNRVYTSKDTTYSAMTAAEATTGTATTGRLITAKVLHDKIGEVADAKIADIDTGVMSVTTGSANGTLSVDGTDVAVKGLASGAYAAAYTHPASGVTADTYGPTANVTGTNNTTLTVPEITVDANGHITGVTERTYTSKDTTYGAGTTALLNTGTDTANRVWPAKQIADYVTGKIGAVDTGVMSVTTGTTNGTISVDGTDVDVKGLGSAAYTASTAYAPASHNQASNTIDAMTGYAKPSSTSAIATTDTLNAAIGKLEKALDGKQASLSAMTAAEATTGTATTARSITAKVLHDKIKAVADASAAAIDTGVMSVTTGETNGTLSVDGTDVAVKGLASGAYSDAYVHPTTAGNKHIPSGGSTGQILRWSAAGTAAWGAENNTTYTGSNGITLTGTNFTNSGVRSIATGTANGTISVNTNGTAADVAVKGLGTAAYTASTAYAAASHGNHVPTTQTANNAVFLRNDNSWQTVTPANIGAAAASHTHNYAGSSSAGGVATSAAKLETARAIDGVNFDGSAAITHYGTCSTAAGTAAKTVACTSFTLVTGSRIVVKFTVTNTAASPTLNVNSTGAKAIQYRGAAITAGYLAANRTYEFVYDGTNYQLVGDIDTNTTYSAGTAALIEAGTDTANRVWSAKILADCISGVKTITTGSTNGTISVDGTNVAVKGLGSAAYTASTAYATASHNHSGTYTPYAASVGSNQKFIYTNSSGVLTAANFEIWITN